MTLPSINRLATYIIIIIIQIMCVCMVGCSAINSILLSEGNLASKESKEKSKQNLGKERKSYGLDKSIDSNDNDYADSSREAMEESNHDNVDNIEIDEESKDEDHLTELRDTDEQQGKIETKQEHSDESGPKNGNSNKFKKFDHSAYVKKLTRLAREIVRKNENIFFARVCKYFTTGARTLSIYKKKGSSFIYTDYWWDQIERRWIKTNPSPPQKMTTLKEHLRASSAGKDCKILKGRIP